METYKRLLAYTRPYLAKIIFSLICAALVAASTSLSAFIVENVVDEIFLKQVYMKYSICQFKDGYVLSIVDTDEGLNEVKRFRVIG